MTLLIIIPTYNEEDNLYSTYSELVSLSRTLDRYRLKIVFINDGSTDNTLQILKTIKEQDQKISIIDLRERMGEWVGFKIAFDNFSSDFVICLPADLQVSCSVIEQAVRMIENHEELDCVYGLGYPHGSGIFSIIFWSWLFLRFHQKIMKAQVDFFLVKTQIFSSRKKNEFYNVIPLEIFISKNFEFLNSTNILENTENQNTI